MLMEVEAEAINDWCCWCFFVAVVSVAEKDPLNIRIADRIDNDDDDDENEVEVKIIAVAVVVWL